MARCLEKSSRCSLNKWLDYEQRKQLFPFEVVNKLTMFFLQLVGHYLEIIIILIGMTCFKEDNGVIEIQDFKNKSAFDIFLGTSVLDIRHRNQLISGCLKDPRLLYNHSFTKSKENLHC